MMGYPPEKGLFRPVTPKWPNFDRTKMIGVDQVYYYLSYGVSDDGNLEYQLVSESTRKEITVFRHYPIDYLLRYIDVALSPNGKIAWREVNPHPKGAEVFAIHEGKVVQLMDNELYAYTMCWLDDDRLLYMACGTDPNASDIWHASVYIPRIWHLDTGEIEDLNTAWRENGNAVMLPFTPQSMAVDPSGRFVACYVSTPFDSIERTREIAIFALADGKNWAFNPWQLEAGRTDGLFHGYMKGRAGEITYDPGDMIDAQLVWYR